MPATKNIAALWKTLTTEGTSFDNVLRKVSIISAGNGKCTAEMKVEKDHANRFGTLHGGYTATLVDMITSMALQTSKISTIGVSVDMHISFMKPAAIGQHIVMEATTIRAGKRLAFTDIVIKLKGKGDIIATGSHTKFVGS